LTQGGRTSNYGTSFNPRIKRDTKGEIYVQEEEKAEEETGRKEALLTCLVFGTFLPSSSEVCLGGALTDFSPERLKRG